MSEATKICLSDFTLDALSAYLVSLGQPKFRAKQIFKWLHQKLVTDFSQMTDQPKTLLAQLAENCTIAAPTIRRRQQSKDGTVKYLLQLGRRQLHRDGFDALPVRQHCMCIHPGGLRYGLPLLRLHPGRPRAGLDRRRDCLQKFTPHRRTTGERVSHIVLMGIGEPLHNFDNVMDFLEIISCPEGVNIGMRNISLSTCGLVPGIDELARAQFAADAFGLPARAGQRDPQPHDAGQRCVPAGDS